MEILLAFAYFAFGYYIIGRINLFLSSDIKISIIRTVYVIKVLAAVAVALIYTYYYTDRSTADIYKYFDDGKVIFSALRDNPLDYLRLLTGIDSTASSLDKYYLATDYWFKIFDYRLFNDNRTIIRFNALLMLVSGSYFAVHVVLMAFFSFCGTFALFRFIATYTTAPRILLLLSTFCVPSFLFWTSGLLKEGILITALGFTLYALQKLQQRQQTLISSAVVVAGIFVLLITKYYVLGCLLPAMLFFMCLNFRTKTPKARTKTFNHNSGCPNICSGHASFIIPAERVRKQIVAFLLIHVGLFIAVLVNTHFKIGLDILDTLAAKRNDYINFAQSIDSIGSYLPMQPIASDIISFLKETPQALYNVFILPLPWQAQSVLFIMPTAENMLLLVLLMAIVIWPNGKGMSLKMILFCTSFSILLYTLSGLITPVLGSLVRYKAPAMPFLYSMLVALVNWEKIAGKTILAKAEQFVCKADRLNEDPNRRLL